MCLRAKLENVETITTTWKSLWFANLNNHVKASSEVVSLDEHNYLVCWSSLDANLMHEVLSSRETTTKNCWSLRGTLIIMCVLLRSWFADEISLNCDKFMTFILVTSWQSAHDAFMEPFSSSDASQLLDEIHIKFYKCLNSARLPFGFNWNCQATFN